MEILVFSTTISPRIKYIFDFILCEFSGLKPNYTTSKERFISTSFPKINYSNERIADEVYLPSDKFMYETTFNVSIDFNTLQPIGKCFYALSRYEEYQDVSRDKHQRFLGEELNYDSPFVDEYILNLQKKLKEKFPLICFKERSFQHLQTFDVDIIWKYKNKGFIRDYFSLLRSGLKLNLKKFLYRLSVLMNKKKDPYDTFDYLKKITEKHRLKTIVFWLVADYAKFDANNLYSKNAFQEKLNEIKQWAEIGLHPSYASNSSLDILRKEKVRLENISQQKIEKSRQHYIKLEFPKTYKKLIKAGIKEDYTMGFAHKTGFRAGTCTAFYWFDLEENERTALKIIPFCAMDVSLNNYLKLSPDESLKVLIDLKHKVKSVNGNFVTLFHNSNLSEEGNWKTWRKLYETLIKE